MSFITSTHYNHDLIVVTCEGNISDGESDKKLENVLRSAENYKKVLLDLTRVPYMDSRAIGTIIRKYKVISDTGGQFKICGLQKRPREIFQLVKISALFESYEGREQAIASFEKARAEA